MSISPTAAAIGFILGVHLFIAIIAFYLFLRNKALLSFIFQRKYSLESRIYTYISVYSYKSIVKYIFIY